MGRFTYVDLNMVKEHIEKTYPDFKFAGQSMIDTYIFRKDSIGVYLSIKVPDPNVYGVAIHLAVRTKEKLKSGEIKDYYVYPLEKLGTGHFQTKIIQRSDNWASKLDEQINLGLEEYEKKYFKTFYITSNGITYKYKNDKPLIQFENDIHFFSFVETSNLKDETIKNTIIKYLDKNRKLYLEALAIDKNFIELLEDTNKNRNKILSVLNDAYISLNGYSIQDYKV